MPSDPTCEKLREIGAELALGVLSGRRRAEALSHLDRCAECREYVEHLTLVGDRLIGLLPASEPPLGFETRVARRLTRAAPANEGRPRARVSGFARGLRGSARRARLRAASAVAGLALAVGFAGWGIGTAIEEATTSPPPAAESTLLTGELTSAKDPARQAGEIYADPGWPGWIWMSVDLAAAGTPYSGRVSCVLEHADGTTVPLGSFDLRGGRGDWVTRAAVDPAKLTGARLTASDGTVLATTRFETGPHQ
ncbi:hypothetical protein ABZ920_06965 [Streptomyces sp. NPDC046831]|uniref:hypothetical protein n=1 Tax=Streptomyces sp. NPDC046831 TaxID=3154805 RepID=UPI003407F647